MRKSIDKSSAPALALLITFIAFFVTYGYAGYFSVHSFRIGVYSLYIIIAIQFSREFLHYLDHLIYYL